MNVEIYVSQVIGVPGSDVGHLPAWRSESDRKSVV